MLACYTDRLSLRPGESFALHASATHGPCTLEIARVGQGRQTVLTRSDIAVADTPTPANADRDGCNWPIVATIEAGADWATGYYDIVLTDQTGESTHHFVCIKPATDKRTARAAFVLATNTYHAYNYWGGACAYCDVDALMTGRLPLEEAMKGAIGVLSTRRPFPQMIIGAPSDTPRLINDRPRGMNERPWAGDLKWRKGKVVTPYDGSAGFLYKWEHVFAAWAERESIALDFFTDYDLETEPGLLDGYAAVVLVGHSEYWSGGQRDAIESFVDAGGNLAIFSGNTAFWKVRFENDGATYVCHKWKGFEADPAAIAEPSTATHLWSHQAFKRPEAEITGLSFIFGGYHRLGNCVARGSAGYTIYDERHWALDGADLFYGDVIGSDIPFVGYESDGCRFQFGADGRLKPVAMLGVPDNLNIIGIAPCAFGEDPNSPYAPIIPPENLEIIARDALGEGSPENQERLLRGHAVMASFKRGKGEVFNGGTTEWAHALGAGDPFFQRITMNVLQRFGVTG